MIGVGLSVGLAGTRQGGAAPNPNLLLWSEAFDNAVWVKTNASVAANAGVDPLGGSTADQITFTAAAGSIRQDSAIAAASGSANNTAPVPTSTPQRFSVSATFDTGTYTFSVWLMDPTDSGYGLTLSVLATGGVIRCRIVDQGDEAVFLVWGAKLEAGASPTGDATNYGMRTT